MPGPITAGCGVEIPGCTGPIWKQDGAGVTGAPTGWTRSAQFDADGCSVGWEPFNAGAVLSDLAGAPQLSADWLTSAGRCLRVRFPAGLSSRTDRYLQSPDSVVGHLWGADQMRPRVTFTTTFTVALTASMGNTTVQLGSGTGILKNRSVLKIDNELMLVTAISGTTATVMRAYGGSTLAAHASLASPVSVYAGNYWSYELGFRLALSPETTLPGSGYTNGMRVTLLFTEAVTGRTKELWTGLTVGGLQTDWTDVLNSVQLLDPYGWSGSGVATTLSANITSVTATTCTVTAATGILVGMVLRVDDELLLVQGIAGTTLTVQRGLAGTAPATHSSGAAVQSWPVPTTCAIRIYLLQNNGANAIPYQLAFDRFFIRTLGPVDQGDGSLLATHDVSTGLSATCYQLSRGQNFDDGMAAPDVVDFDKEQRAPSGALVSFDTAGGVTKRRWRLPYRLLTADDFQKMMRLTRANRGSLWDSGSWTGAKLPLVFTPNIADQPGSYYVRVMPESRITQYDGGGDIPGLAANMLYRGVWVLEEI